jgi:hypothetical protein
MPGGAFVTIWRNILENLGMGDRPSSVTLEVLTI